MPSPTLATAIGTAVVALVTFTVYIWRVHGQFDEKYLERVEELQDQGWSLTSSELRALFEQVEAKVTEDNPGGEYEDLSRGDRIEFFIQEEIDRGELQSVEESLEEIDRPRAVYEEARYYYRRAASLFSAACIIGTLTAILFATPLTGDAATLRLLTGTVAVSAFAIGADNWRDARSAHNELDAMWEDYYFD